MDIIFKFGQQFYESSENSILNQFALSIFGAFLGFGSALFIYYKKIRSDRKTQKRIQQIETANKLKYHKLLIDNIVKNTKNQVVLLNKYKIDQEKDLLIILPPMQIATNEFERLIYINKDIFDSLNYINKHCDNWIEDFKRLNTTIDFIEGTLKEIHRISSNHLEISYRNALEIKQKIELIPDKLTSFAFKLQNDLGEKRWQNGLYLFVDAAIKEYLQLVEEKADLNKLNNVYLDPMMRNILEFYKNELFFEEIIFLCKCARVKMNDIKTDMKNTINVFVNINAELERTIKDVEELNNKIHIQQ